MNSNVDVQEEILKQKAYDIELKKKNILIDIGILIHDNINVNKIPKVLEA